MEANFAIDLRTLRQKPFIAKEHPYLPPNFLRLRSITRHEVAFKRRFFFLFNFFQRIARTKSSDGFNVFILDFL